MQTPEFDPTQRRTLLDRLERIGNALPEPALIFAILAALVAGPAGARVYNVGDGNPVTKEALARWIAERLGQPAPVFDPSAPAGPRVAKGGRTQPRR